MRKLVVVVSLFVSAPPVTGAEEIYRKQSSWAESMTATRGALADRADRDARIENLCRKLWEDFPETDWFMQDAVPAIGAQFVPARDFAPYFNPDRDSAFERELIGRVLAELGDSSAELKTRFDTLAAAHSIDDPAWLELYVEACRLRRAERLRPLLTLAPRIVFTKHYTLGGSHYAYTEGQSDAQAERHFIPGSALCLLELDAAGARVETLLAEPGGVIRDPDVSHDGRRVLFSLKKSDRHDDYHLYEMDLATRAVRQLTHGLGVADYEGAYLPGGDVLFNSSRCVQIVDCWWTEVSNLYRCDPDGRFLRRLTFDQVHDNYPTVTEDGRVLYTRWEYNDRGQIYPQPLLQMFADGTGQMEFYGVNSWFPTTILHARMIPGTQRVLAVASGHHSRQTGKLIVIDPARGRQENAGVRLIAPIRETTAEKIDAYGQSGELFQYPYPLSETHYLVTYHPIGWPWAAGSLGPRFGVYLMTRDGRRELLASDPALPCSQPIPLRSRPTRPSRSTLVDYRRADGVCYVQDVYAGSGLDGVARGAVKTLRAVALRFRAAGIGSNGNSGPGGGALVSTPIAVGNGAWDPKVILGDATVHADGSAMFRLPARTPVYFQLLDAKGRMIQTMRSWTTLQPGENASCVGCHEHRNTTPVAEARPTLAMRAGPQDLKPFYGPPRGFSFSREIQPILDRACATCHAGRDDTPYDLTASEVDDPRAKRKWSRAYLALTHARAADEKNAGDYYGDAENPLVNWVSAQSAPPMLPPHSAGSARSKLLHLLEAGHEDAVLSSEDLHKLAAWIDLGVPYCGDYTEAADWTPAEVEKYRTFAAKRATLADEEQSQITDFLRTRDPGR